MKSENLGTEKDNKNNLNPEDEARKKDDKVPEPDYKFTSIENVTLPEGVIYKGHAIYSKTGHIILLYKMENDTMKMAQILKNYGEENGKTIMELKLME